MYVKYDFCILFLESILFYFIILCILSYQNFS